MKLIEEIMNHRELQQKPPVLVDIGASGVIHKQWKQIAPYSVCLAFDADTRDFSVDEVKSEYKKLFRINRIVAAGKSDSADFWLTKSPHCSSSLSPNNAALQAWAFAPLFEVEKQIKLSAVTLGESLTSCGLGYIDWYKSDSQGTDLRLFTSLPESTRQNILVAEFEPGILNAYLGEDKLSSLMLYMEDKPFWVQNMILKGSQRISQDSLKMLRPVQRRFISTFLRTSPGWCEIAYMNDFQLIRNRRDFMLGWVIAMLLKEHGYALDLAERARVYFGDSIFFEMRVESLNQLRKGYLRLPGRFLKRVVAKVL
jgi:hypothetical protein